MWLAALAAVATLLMPAGCGKDGDSPIGPAHKPVGEYEVVVNTLMVDSINGDSFVLRVYDPENDSLKQVLPFSSALAAMTTTKNGLTGYFSKIYPRDSIEIWSAAWPPTAVQHSHVGLGSTQLLLSPDETYLLGSMGMTVLYALPDLTPVYIDSANALDAAFLPGRTQFCYHHFLDDTLIMVDYGSLPATVTRRPLRGVQDEALEISTICPSSGGDSLIISAYNWRTYQDFVIVASTADLGIIDQVVVDRSLEFAAPLLHSDGRHVFWQTPDAIYGYDITTKDFRIVVDDGEGLWYSQQRMALSPDGEYLFVKSINSLLKLRFSDGVVTVIDTLSGQSQNFVVWVRAAN